MSGGPSWIENERFDVRATYHDDASPAEQSEMLRALLTERFHVQVHVETRDLHFYKLIIARPDGQIPPTLSLSTRDCAKEPAVTQEVLNDARESFEPPCGWGLVLANRNAANTKELSTLADVLSRNPDIGRLVVDATGLTGKFSYYLAWKPMPGQLAPPHDPSFDEPSIFAALEEQLGLKLVPVDGPRDVLIVDHAKPPTPD
jgi:uncharacterized protein (TIGR03435 family)